MVFIILTFLILIYVFSVPKVRTAKYGAKVALKLRMAIFVATPILIVLLFGETYNIYPRQYWFTKGFFLACNFFLHVSIWTLR